MQVGIKDLLDGKARRATFKLQPEKASHKVSGSIELYLQLTCPFSEIFKAAFKPVPSKASTELPGINQIKQAVQRAGVPDI